MSKVDSSEPYKESSDLGMPNIVSILKSNV